MEIIMMTAGFSFSEGTPGGPIGGTEYKILDQKLRQARSAQRQARPLLEQGKTEEAVQILIDLGKMSPKEIKSWMVRKLAPQMKSLNPQRIQEVYIHANELERLRIEQQLKKITDE